jgi:uncharacterized Zn-binding protein involved in type VI secretion
MAAIALEDCLSVGEAGYPPTLPSTGLSTKTRVGGKHVVLNGQTMYAAHSKPKSPTHTEPMRIVTSGSSKAKIEGMYIARIGDSIADGDTINQGFDKVNVG